MRRRSLASIALITPLGLALLLNFLGPIAVLLARGFHEHELPEAWPRTAAMIRDWDGRQLPGPGVVTAISDELRASRRAGTLSGVANRLNYDVPGLRSLVFNTARDLDAYPDNPASLQYLQSLDRRWGDLSTWNAIKQAAGPLTSFYLLAAVDRREQATGEIVAIPPSQAVFVNVFARTFAISSMVTCLCVLIGFPAAYTLASLPRRWANPLLALVLLPFWTSVLVRSTAWMILLQDQGIANDVLRAIGLISHPLRLIYNRTGVLIAMTHVLLPYFLLPLYGVMRAIGPATQRAALSLGATPVSAFWRVYFPQTLPGVTAGALIVFILALGYYITPALLGGPGDQMISTFIAYYTNQALNWGMAAALSLVLLAATLLLITLYSRVAGKWEVALR